MMTSRTRREEKGEKREKKGERNEYGCIPRNMGGRCAGVILVISWMDIDMLGANAEEQRGQHLLDGPLLPERVIE